MAKMFYSVEEAAKKLGKSVDEVKRLASSGQLQEFRDGSKLVFKREQVDLLSGGTEGDDIGMADSGSGEISLADSGASSGTSGESTKERSGISIFEADDNEGTVDASAQTQITQSVGGMKVGDAAGSGSGLLDLTRDSSDDTGIGAGIMSDVYGDKDGSASADFTPARGGGGGNALFESSGVPSDVSGVAAGPMMMVAEQVDGPSSGLAGGLALAMIVVCAVTLIVALYGLVGFGGGLVGMLTGNFLPALGGMAVLVLVCGVIGWVVGKKG